MALSRQLRRYRGWIAAGVLVAVVAVAYVAFAQTSDDDTPGVTYTTEQVTLGTISVTVSGTGERYDRRHDRRVAAERWHR